jgi:polyisoprenoid-binding protein YceI
MTAGSKWVVDPGHSEVRFKVRHLGIANVTGRFKVFEGELLCGRDGWDGSEVRVTLNPASIDSNNAQRDGHLVSADFLDAENYPAIGFRGLVSEAGDSFVVDGELEIRGVRRKVRFAAEETGVGTGRFGDKRAGFEVRGKINRKDFGLHWNILAEGGGLVVGEEIGLQFDIELVQAKG